MPESKSYSNKAVSQDAFWGTAASILGWFTALTFWFVVFVLGLVAANHLGRFMAIPIAICGIFGLGGTFLVVRGKKMRSRVRWFKNYKMIIQDRQQVSLVSLAQRRGCSPEQVSRELQQMIERGYFINAYMDQNSQCIILENGRVNDLKWQGEQEGKAMVSATCQENPGADGVVAQGAEYLRQIQRAGKNVKSPQVRQQIQEIQAVIRKILEVIRQEPSKTGKIRKFLDYYLPTTLKLLNSYSLLEDQGVNRETIGSTMHNIEVALGTIRVAFENQLDHLFEKEAMDISTDITVLENMLAQEGLTGDSISNMNWPSQ